MNIPRDPTLRNPAALRAVVARSAAAVLLLTTLTACSNTITGIVGITMRPDGHLGLALGWCGRPDKMGAWILRPDPWRAVVEYSNPHADGAAESDAFDMYDPAAPWQFSSGKPDLQPGATYRAEGWPGDGKEGAFGHTYFTLTDVRDLKQGQVWYGDPGSVITWQEFLKAIPRFGCD